MHIGVPGGPSGVFVWLVLEGRTAAVADGAGVEEEGRGEDDGGDREGRADAGEVTYGADHGSGGGLAEGAGLATHRDHGGPHPGLESLVEPREVERLREGAGEAREPEGRPGEGEAPGQGGGEQAHHGAGV